MGTSDSPPSSANTAIDSGPSIRKAVDGQPLERVPTHVRHFWKFHMRPADDDDLQ